MRHERITPQELRGVLRREGLESPEQVKKAYVETSGRLTVIKRAGGRRRRRPETGTGPRAEEAHP